LNHFGGARTVIGKINPRDVVSIPSDYNATKGRACRYEVIGEIDADKVDQAFTRSVQSNSTNYDKPVKEGDTPFKAGYTNGYKGLYNAQDDYFGRDRLMYREGYEKGAQHAREGRSEEYRYVKAQPTVRVNVQNGAWPFPNKG
jgi:hypothetical protein